MIGTGRRDWLWLVAGVALVGAAGVIIISLFTSGSGGGGAKAVLAGVECEAGERLDYHVHAHLDLIIDGRVSLRQQAQAWCLFYCTRTRLQHPPRRGTGRTRLHA